MQDCPLGLFSSEHSESQGLPLSRFLIASSLAFTPTSNTHHLHISLPNQVLPLSPKLALSLPFPRSFPVIFTTHYPNIYSSALNVKKPVLMFPTATTSLPLSIFLELYLSLVTFATNSGISILFGT